MKDLWFSKLLILEFRHLVSNCGHKFVSDMCICDTINVNSGGFIRCLHLYFASFLLQPFVALCVFFLFWHTDRCTNSCPWPCASMCLESSPPESKTMQECVLLLHQCAHMSWPITRMQKCMWSRLIGVFHMGTFVVTAGLKWHLTEVFVNCDICWEFVVFFLECQHFRLHFPELFPKILHFKFLGVLHWFSLSSTHSAKCSRLSLRINE